MIAKILISPSLQARVEEISKILSQAELKNSHPDLLYFSSDSKLGIEQARKIKEHFSLKPYSGKGRGVVLEDASDLTIEAQNALLKTLEELPENAIFVLGATSDSKLLPTILSRCNVEFLSTKYQVPSTKYSKDIEKLLDATIEQRFEYIEKLKDREEFLYALISYFRNQLFHLSHGRSTNEINNFLKELLQAEEWHRQNVNLRAILEYLMLAIPPK